MSTSFAKIFLKIVCEFSCVPRVSCYTLNMKNEFASLSAESEITSLAQMSACELAEYDQWLAECDAKFSLTN